MNGDLTTGDHHGLDSFDAPDGQGMAARWPAVFIRRGVPGIAGARLVPPEGGSETALRAWSHFAHWMAKCGYLPNRSTKPSSSSFWIRICRAATAIPRVLRTQRLERQSLDTCSPCCGNSMSSWNCEAPAVPTEELEPLQRPHARRPRPGDRHARGIGWYRRSSAAMQVRGQGHRHRRVAAGRRSRLHRNRVTRSAAGRMPARSPLRCEAHFRYRGTCGDAVNSLLGAISSPVRWSQTSLPRALTTEGGPAPRSALRRGQRTPAAPAGHGAPGLDLGLRVGDRQAGDRRLRLACRNGDLEANKVPAPGCPTAAGAHRAGSGGGFETRAARNHAAIAVRPSVGATTSPSAPMQ